MNEMIKAAKDKGILMYGITDHAPAMPGTCTLMHFQNLRSIDRTAYGLELLLGVEVNILDQYGTIDMEDAMLKQLDVVIASQHINCMSETQVSREKNTEALIKVMQNPYVNIIGHPDDGRLPLDYPAVVQAAKEYQCLLELNNSSLLPQTYRKRARENAIEYLQLCKEYGVEIIINSDAHVDTTVGNHAAALALLEELDFPEELVVNADIERAKKYLNRYRLH